MRAADILFYVLALFSLVFGLLAVTTRHIFRAGIYLLFTLIGIAGIYFWMSYEFIAAVQIVVYVGGIVVLILFSILLTQKAGEQLPVQRGGRGRRQQPRAGIVKIPCGRRRAAAGRLPGASAE